MSEPKFTPGPWFTDDYGYIFSGERRDAHMIAEVRGWGWIQYLPDPEQIQDANAHLIAAAPELYEACEIFAEWLRREEAGFDHKTHDRNTPEGEAAWREWFYGNLEICGEAQDKAKAALAKARGKG